MDSLFDQLKSAPPVNANAYDPPTIVELSKPTKRSFSPITGKDSPAPQKIKKKNEENAALRRESMPPPETNLLTKAINKSRSLSPPKGTPMKSLKIMLERKKMEDSSGKKSHKLGKAEFLKSSTDKHLSDADRSATVKNGEKQPKKATPTKAQQKLFDPAVLVKAQQLKQLKVKRCKVRLLKQDLEKLQKEFHAKKKYQKKNKQLNKETSSISNKNHRDNSTSPLSPKRGRPSNEKDSKQTGGFFIKINAISKSPKTTKIKTRVGRSQKDKKSVQKFSVGSIAKRVNAAAAISSTKPTKFTRTQLIKMYGKRVFCSRVRIERCSHPMMLIFESNDRARRLQAKRSKSKNLSVSFREQVEIFGDSSDSDETDTSQMFVADVASTSTITLKTANPTVTPARLKKVENGKVVDDIELDPSLFVAPPIASTPFPSAGRKKREKKSFSPLKGDGAPSPRKEQLKLANEKMPPSSLRRLTVDEADEDDDEDDDCEYIVPIDIPDRRISRTSSLTTLDEPMEETEPEELPRTEFESTPMNISDSSANKSSANNSSGESFASAIEQPLDKSSSLHSESENNVSTQNITTNGALVDSAINVDKPIEKANEELVDEEKGDNSVLAELPKLIRIDSISPSHSLNSFNDVVGSLIKNVNDDVPTASSDAIKSTYSISKTNNIDLVSEIPSEKDVPQQITVGETKLPDTLNDDISLQMFVDDDNTAANSTFLEDSALKDSEIVDGIVQERIQEISKNKQLDSPNEAARNLLSSEVTAE